MLINDNESGLFGQILSGLGNGLASSDTPFGRSFAGGYYRKENEAAKKQAQELMAAKIASEKAQAELLSAQTLEQARKRTQQRPQFEGRMPTMQEALEFKMQGGADLLDFVKLSNSGNKRDAGSYYQNPINGQWQYMPKIGEGQTMTMDGGTMAIPGAPQAAASIKGAETSAVERARYPFTIGAQNNQSMNTPREYYDEETGTPRITNNFTAARGGVTGATPGINPMARGIPQNAQQGEIPRSLPRRPLQMPGDSDRKAILSGEMEKTRAALQQTKDPAQIARLTQDLSSIDREMRGAGFGATASQSAGLAAGQSTGAKMANENTVSLNKDFLEKDYRPVLDAGTNAGKALTTVKTARLALSGLGDTGFGTDAKVAAANVLGALGVNKAEQYAANGAMFRTAAASRVNDILLEAKGVQTEGDAQRAALQFAQLKDPAMANQFALDLAEAAANLQAKKSKYYQQAMGFAQENKVGDLSEIGRRWSKHSISIWDDPVMQKWGKK